MQHVLRFCLTALLILTAAASTAGAADETTTVRVALLDMSSVMPTGMMGQAMTNPNMTNPNMMGPNMMGPNMMMGPAMMGMMTIRIDRPTVKAGTVTFDVTNWSRSVLHEVLVISVDNQAAPLPYDYVQTRVVEEQVKVLGEAEDLQPNASKTFEIALTSGSYLLICNVAGTMRREWWRHSVSHLKGRSTMRCSECDPLSGS